jgi:hypothetical protein
MILELKIRCLRAAFLPVALVAMVIPVPPLERIGERLLLRTIDLEKARDARDHLRETR